MNKATHPKKLGSLRKADSITETPLEIASIRVYLLAVASISRLGGKRIGDHCRPSNISALVYGCYATFQRPTEQALNRRSEPCAVARYSLLPHEHQRVFIVNLLHRRHKQPDDQERLIALRR